MRAPTIDHALGGRIGRRALPSGLWFSPAPWAYWCATLCWWVLVVRQWPCMTDPSSQYSAGCYSDIAALWVPRGIASARVPYLQEDLEYPVLTGGLIHGTRLLSGLLPGTDPLVAFFGLTSILLFGCFLGLVAVHLRLAPGWQAMMVAASPLVVASGLINWDLLPVFLTSAALLAWQRRRPGLAGALIGLGTAAKLYPVLLLVPLVVLAVRAGRRRPALEVVAAAIGAWAVVNVPVLLLAPEGWLTFWTFNADRAADLGSVWYLLAGVGGVTPGVSALVALAMVAGVGGVAALLLLAPTPPRAAQGAFLVVLVFCLGNVVYSPQYMLWLLPLLVLARPVWRDWAVFTFGELVYWAAVWAYLDGALYAGDGRARLYWAAIAVRVVIQAWLGWRVVRDVLWPWQDPVARKEGSWPAR